MTVTPILRPKGYEPGLPFLGRGIERYPIRGGGAAVISLEQGDEIELIDPEGLQRCEIAVFGKDGREDAAALGAVASGPASGIAAILSGDGEDAAKVALGLKRRGVAFGDCRAVVLFDGDSRPGESVSFTAQRDVICIVAAPGSAMTPDQQTPPTARPACGATRRASHRSRHRPKL
jgi:aminomethyltransferase